MSLPIAGTTNVIGIPNRFGATNDQLVQWGTTLTELQNHLLARLKGDNPATTAVETNIVATPEEITGANLRIQMAQSRVTAIKGVLEAEKNHNQGMARVA